MNLGNYLSYLNHENLILVFILISLAEYVSLIQPWRLKENEDLEDYPWKISDTMYKQNIDNVSLYLYLIVFKTDS